VFKYSPLALRGLGPKTILLTPANAAMYRPLVVALGKREEGSLKEGERWGADKV